MTNATDAQTINHDGIDRKLIDDATPAGSASGEDGDGVANCAECGAFLEHVRPGKHQHPTCSHVASALQAEVAQLRELATLIVDGAMPATTSGATCFVPRYQIDKLRAAMGSANGQG